jgi:hypothetical protein
LLYTEEVGHHMIYLHTPLSNSLGTFIGDFGKGCVLRSYGSGVLHMVQLESMKSIAHENAADKRRRHRN